MSNIFEPSCSALRIIGIGSDYNHYFTRSRTKPFIKGKLELIFFYTLGELEGD